MYSLKHQAAKTALLAAALNLLDVSEVQTPKSDLTLLARVTFEDGDAVGECEIGHFRDGVFNAIVGSSL